MTVESTSKRRQIAIYLIFEKIRCYCSGSAAWIHRISERSDTCPEQRPHATTGTALTGHQL